MSEHGGAADDTARSYRLDRLAGFSVVGAFVLALALLIVGEPLFWVPFAVGLGIGLPGFAILADRERDHDRASGPATAAEAEAAAAAAAEAEAAEADETETESDDGEDGNDDD